MRQKFFIIALMLGVLVPVAAYGAIFQAGEEVGTQSGQVVAEDVYLAGGMVQSMAHIQGDIIGAGGNVSIMGSTTQDVMVAGGQITISGNVGDDVRATGGTITLSGNVGGDVLLAGGQIVIQEGSTIGGEVIITGGSVVVNSVVNGPMKIRAEKITIGSQAVINSTLTYSSPERAVVENQSSLRGEVVFNQTDSRRQAEVFNFGNLIFKLIALFVIALLVQWLFRSRALQLSLMVRNNPWRNLARGFIALIIVPVLILLCFITIIGIPVAVIAFCAYVIMLIASYLLLPTVVGAWVMKYAGKSETLIVDWKSALAGTLVMVVLGIIPGIGGLVSFLLALILFGFFVKYVMNLISRNSF